MGRVMSTKTCNISETMQDRTKVTMTNYLEVACALSIRTKINDLEWPKRTVAETFYGTRQKM